MGTEKMLEKTIMLSQFDDVKKFVDIAASKDYILDLFDLNCQ